MRNLIILFFVFCSYSLSAQLQPDSSFASNGAYTLEVPGGNFYMQRVLEQNDGSQLTAGCYYLLSGPGGVRIQKTVANGTLDQSFGVNGFAQNSLMDQEMGYFRWIKDIDTFSDGRIIVLVENNLNESDLATKISNICLAVFHKNGTVDSSFGNNGYIISRPQSGFDFVPKAIAINRDGGNEVSEDQNDIYVGGWAYENGHASCGLGYGKWFVASFKGTGQLNTLFNGSGARVESAAAFNGSSQSPLAVVQDVQFKDGKLLGIGNMHNLDSRYFSFRMNPDGSWDNSFQSIGRITYPVNWSVYSNDFTDAQLLADGGAAFYTTISTMDSSVINILRTKPDGSVLTSFGSNGSKKVIFMSQQLAVLAFKTDLSFMSVCYRKYGANGTNQKIDMTYYFANGSQDMSFGTNGYLSTQIITPDTYINASAISDAIWNKNQNRLYMVTNRQPTGLSFTSIGLYRYYWFGIPPLSIAKGEASANPSLFPNQLIKIIFG